MTMPQGQFQIVQLQASPDGRVVPLLKTGTYADCLQYLSEGDVPDRIPTWFVAIVAVELVIPFTQETETLDYKND